jgi:hypothetical protein
MASSDQTGPKPISAPDDMHWGINYLREDIQDIRAEARESRADAKADHAALRVEIGSLREAMEAGDSALREAMEAGDAALREAITAGDSALRAEISSLRETLLQRLDSRFYLTMGMMATMIGVLAALMKL